jgi:circadian clock protein KaiB
MTSPDESPAQSLVDFDAASEVLYQLALYVSGASDLSARAIANARQLCDFHLAGRYHLAIVDVHEDPPVASSRVFATPTLVRERPLPVRTIVGDLSHTEKVLLALDLPGANDVSNARG